MQYTARDVRSGLLFLAFAQRRSAAASEVFAARIQRHLDRYGVSLRDLVWQTDNGGEFVGRHNAHGPRTGFPSALGDSQHVRIPPAAHTYQSDVETVHRLVCEENSALLRQRTHRGCSGLTGEREPGRCYGPDAQAATCNAYRASARIPRLLVIGRGTSSEWGTNRPGAGAGLSLQFPAIHWKSEISRNAFEIGNGNLRECER